MNTLDQAKASNDEVIARFRDEDILRVCNACNDPITDPRNKFCICTRCVNYFGEFGGE